MQLIRGWHNLRARHMNCVLTIGNFDGVHLGHQAVLRGVVEAARQRQLSSCVMLFEPQPRELFARLTNQVPPARLCHFRDKYQYIAQLGIDNLLLVNFNTAFAALEACDFVDTLLVEQLGVQHLLVGDDFVFGKNKVGSFSYLQQNAPFTVERSASLTLPIGAQASLLRVSSTAIREMLQTGDFERATAMLGRPYCMEGRVFHGDKRGRQLGFPTANLLIKREYCALRGVFAVAVQTQSGRFLGVANIGNRPTLGGERVQLEVHLFDFNGNLYGQRIEVQFYHKLRDEQKFASLPALQRQIESDALAAQAWLKLHNISGHDGK